MLIMRVGFFLLSLVGRFIVIIFYYFWNFWGEAEYLEISIRWELEFGVWMEGKGRVG